ncbi:MAG: HD-GYP domain-containing protein, partial [Bacillota bacterium]
MQESQINQAVRSVNNDFFININNSPSLNQLLQQLKEKDNYTYHHSFNAYMYSVAIGEQLQLKNDALNKLGWGALLHDIGKLEIADRILKKPRQLTDLEYNQIKKHPLNGVQILTKSNIISNLKTSVLEHHENFDGSGYPFGLSGTNIS